MTSCSAEEIQDGVDVALIELAPSLRMLLFCIPPKIVLSVGESIG